MTLRCSGSITSSNLTTDFYKDGLLVGSSSSGTLTIQGVSAADEGSYMCNMSGAGLSPDCWLSVTGETRSGVQPSFSSGLS